MLKAKISQVKSNLYAVKTTKYDTTDLELTVETADSSPWLNPRFELLGIKPDGHEVHQTENFKVVDLNNHIVQVTLDEQFVTCEGNVDLQLLIKDDSRKSSTPFKLFVGRSLDSDILESHRNVKVLDELEKYIIEGREYISEATELAQSTANYIQAVNTQAEANESQRLQNESQRQSAETKRKEAEDGRKQAEDGRKQAEVLRVQNEDTRQSAEVIRIANEQTRLENESNRIERETARENKESIRQTQEQQRHNAESTRQSQESTRQSNEDNRKQAEKSRNQEEAARINNEATREQAEDTRNSQELDRQSAESARRTSETNRNNAESTRTQSENTRQSQETSRITNEQARARQEQERVNNENTRKTEEAKRVDAEELRKEAYTEATQLLEELRNFEPITENDRTDYMGNVHQTLKAKNDADVDWLLGEINTVHYDGQHITATDTIEGRSKSAILSGQTLVNTLSTCINKPLTKTTHTGHINFLKPLESGKEYTIIISISNAVASTDSKIINIRGNNVDGTYKSMYDGVFKITNGIQKVKFTPTDGFATCLVAISCNAPEGSTATIDYLMFIEGDHTNEDIPYFTGMQSVKMPVLTTTGKNIIDGQFKPGTVNWNITTFPWFNDAVLGSATRAYLDNPLNLISGKKYTVSCINPNYVFAVHEKELGSTYKNDSGWKINKPYTFTATNNCYALYVRKNNDSAITQDELKEMYNSIMVEEGETPTSYEPHQSNILTVNEEVELRGIGEVQDTLDCLTGEVTERIGEMIVDSVDDWWSATNTDGSLRLGKKFNNVKLNSKLTCDLLPTIGFNNEGGQKGVSIYQQQIVLYTGHTNIEEIKSWIAQNPLTIQYELVLESIKTVDLSNNHVYSYKGTTHYDCSSAEGSLVPTLSIDVPTNLSALVSRQRETIRDQEDQIKLLEETNSELIISQETQDEEIVTNMLASVELFEMVLSMTPLSIDMSKSMGVNPMVEVYVTLILKGEKTIEQVPAVIRDKVQAQLDLLTK